MAAAPATPAEARWQLTPWHWAGRGQEQLPAEALPGAPTLWQDPGLAQDPGEGVCVPPLPGCAIPSTAQLKSFGNSGRARPFSKFITTRENPGWTLQSRERGSSDGAVSKGRGCPWGHQGTVLAQPSSPVPWDEALDVPELSFPHPGLIDRKSVV